MFAVVSATHRRYPLPATRALAALCLCAAHSCLFAVVAARNRFSFHRKHTKYISFSRLPRVPFQPSRRASFKSPACVCVVKCSFVFDRRRLHPRSSAISANSCDNCRSSCATTTYTHTSHRCVAEIPLLWCYTFFFVGALVRTANRNRERQGL